MREIQRIHDQLVRAWQGEAWHGPSLRRIVEGIDAATAGARPLADGHSIWQIVRHITVWEDVVRRRLAGDVIGELPAEQDWPAVTGTGDPAWREAVAELEAGSQRLREAVSSFPDDRLDETVPGRSYSFYVMLHGIVQHDLYHGGQIALLRKAAPLRRS